MAKANFFCTRCVRRTQNKEENPVFRSVRSDVSTSVKRLAWFSSNLVWAINCRETLINANIRPKLLMQMQRNFIKFIKNCSSYSAKPVHGITRTLRSLKFYLIHWWFFSWPKILCGTALKIHDYYQDNCSSLDAVYSWTTSHLVSTLN